MANIIQVKRTNDLAVDAAELQLFPGEFGFQQAKSQLYIGNEEPVIVDDIPVASKSKLELLTVAPDAPLPLNRGGLGADLTSAHSNALLIIASTDDDGAKAEITTVPTQKGAMYVTNTNETISFGLLPVSAGGTGLDSWGKIEKQLRIDTIESNIGKLQSGQTNLNDNKLDKISLSPSNDFNQITESGFYKIKGNFKNGYTGADAVTYGGELIVSGSDAELFQMYTTGETGITYKRAAYWYDGETDYWVFTHWERVSHYHKAFSVQLENRTAETKPIVANSGWYPNPESSGTNDDLNPDYIYTYIVESSLLVPEDDIIVTGDPASNEYWIDGGIFCWKQEGPVGGNCTLTFGAYKNPAEFSHSLNANVLVLR